MRKFLLILCFAFMLVGTVYAQAKKAPAKATPAKAAPAKAAPAKAAPKPAAQNVAISTKEPSFVGFTGSFLKYGDMSGKSRPFSMSIEYKPWFFEVKGMANSGHNTEDLEIFVEDMVVVMAYYDAIGKAADGTEYQAALFDLMIYVEEAPIAISNLNFTLIGKAAQSSATIAQAKKWNFEQGQVFKNAKYSSAIFKAQAAALDKSDIEKELQAEKKRVADSVAREEKRKRDSIAAERKRVSDSIAKAEKRKSDSIANVKDSIARVEKRKSDSIAAGKKRVSDSLANVEKRKRDSIAAERKRVSDSIERNSEKKVKEKKPVVEEDEEPPTPRKKIKRRKVVVEKDEEDEPPKKKVKRRKKKPVEEE